MSLLVAAADLVVEGGTMSRTEEGEGTWIGLYPLLEVEGRRVAVVVALLGPRENRTVSTESYVAD